MILFTVKNKINLCFVFQFYNDYLLQKPSVVVVVPQILNKLFENKLPLKVRIIISGGAPIRKNVWDYFIKYSENIFNGYGSTETSGAIALSRERDNIGVPCRGVAIKLSDIGEVLVRGWSVGVEEIPVQWFNTKDIAEITEDGKLRLIGRSDNTIKLQQGEYINLDYLSEIYSEKFTVCVCASSLDRYVSAVVFTELPQEEVKKQLEKIHEENYLRGFERIKHFIIISENDLPKLPTGKIDYAKIRRSFSSQL